MVYNELVKKLMTLILVDLIKKTEYDPKINEVEGKVCSTTGSATTVALKAVKKTPNDQTLKPTNSLLILVIINLQVIFLMQK